MDFGTECSVLESVDDNETIKLEKVSDIKAETIIENNGSCNDEHFGEKLLLDSQKEEIIVTEPVDWLSNVANTSPSPTTTKGHGLRKWRRIKREMNNDWGNNVDNNSRMLKRGLSNASGANSIKPVPLLTVMNQKSAASDLSTNATVKSKGAAGDFLGFGDSGLVVGPVFAAGTDSENSEDRSSKSSTAASAPRMRYETPPAAGFRRDKSNTVTIGGKHLGNPILRGQQGKGRSENSKKPRGERVKIEKENSHSSMESDSRSSKFVFMQGINSPTSNGGQGMKSMYFDRENSGEPHVGAPQSDDRFQTSYGGKAVDKSADVSYEERSENYVPSADHDFLVESITSLHSVQDALEKEVQKLRDIGKDEFLGSEDGTSPSKFSTLGPKTHEQCSSDEVQNDSREARALKLGQEDVYNLETRLQEVTTMLKLKEARVVDLESSLNNKKSKEKEASTTALQHYNHENIETELVDLFMQRIEVEVVNLVVSRKIQTLKVAFIKISEEQKALAHEQMSKLVDAEGKVNVLKAEVEKLDNSCVEMVRINKYLKRPDQVRKYALCFFLQLIAILGILVLFSRRLLPQNADVMPT